MSGHMRFGLAAFLVVAGFSTPAAANAITDFFSPSPAPEAATPAPAPAQDDCLSRPGEQTAAGQHWVYRYDGHRKCWFQAAADTARARKPARRRAARQSVAAPEQDQSALRKQENVEDAHAEMTSPAPEQAPQSAPSEPKLTIVRTIPVHLADAAAQVPPAPDLAKPVLNKPVPSTPGADQLTPDQPNSDQSGPRQLDVETLLAKAPAASDEVASAPPPTPVAAPTVKTGDGEDGITWWLGVLLMALGAAALLSSSRTLRRALWPVRSPDSGTDPSVIAHGGRDEPSFDRSASVSPARDGDELLRYDPRSVAPLVHAARARRPVAPALPSRKAI